MHCDNVVTVGRRLVVVIARQDAVCRAVAADRTEGIWQRVMHAGLIAAFNCCHRVTCDVSYTYITNGRDVYGQSLIAALSVWAVITLNK